MTPYEFGKRAADPRAADMNPAASGAMGGNTALIGGQLANPTPEYDPGSDYYATPTGLEFRKSQNRAAQNAFSNQLMRADNDRYANEAEERGMNQLSAASGLAPHMGAAIGQPLLGAAAGMAGTAIGGLGANKARLDRPAIQKNLQEQKQNYESVTPPNQRGIYKMPFFGKAGSLIEFGAKVAQSTCSPCDMPNGPANKKHMTGASPAVTEAGEHSEEFGTPEVAETEHSDAKAKMPEEGAKSAYAFGYMLGR
jgi:hypothetical protein